MPSEIPEHAVLAENLSKRFRIGTGRTRKGGRFPGRRGKEGEVWAIRNVSFDVGRGESVGIIGRNGAGKSTLLEIIAGIRPPTEGRARIRGRVAALLQLGAGFHPEFSGRENIYLSGSIQGFSRREIRERFDDIAAFADIGRFLDQPVKTYSSGMYARLAFAAAMAYEPDILIVDEILAVGDALFQQKCMTRLEQMRDGGLTLLFVSHSIDRVNALCDRALYLDRGQMQFFGETAVAADLYLESIRTEQSPKTTPSPGKARRESRIVEQQTRGLNRYGSREARILAVEIRDDRSRCREEFELGETIAIHVHYGSETETDDLNVSFLVRDETGVNLLGTMTWDEGVVLPPVKPGDSGTVTFSFRNRLRPGRFGVCVAITRINREDPRKPYLYDQIDGVASFSSRADPDRPIHYKFDARIEVEMGGVE